MQAHRYATAAAVTSAFFLFAAYGSEVSGQEVDVADAIRLQTPALLPPAISSHGGKASPGVAPLPGGASLSNTEAEIPAAANVATPTESQPKVLPAVAPGDRLLIEADGLARQAASTDDYTRIVSICQGAMDAGTSPKYSKYGFSLMSWAFNRRGEMLVQQGNLTLAMSDFQAAVAHDRTRWRAVHNRGVSLAGLGQTREALADFDMTIELKPDYAIAYFNRAELHYELGEFDRAIADYSQAINLDNKDVHARCGRGHCNFQLGKLREAVIDFTIALKFDPDNLEALVSRGEIYTELGYFANALRDYKKAIGIDAEFAPAHQAAAWLMATCPDAKFRNDEAAVQAAVRAIRLSGDEDHTGYDTLAAALANAGRFEEAKRAIQRAQALAPESLKKLYHSRAELYAGNQAFRVTPKRLEHASGSPEQKDLIDGLAAEKAGPPVTQSLYQSTDAAPKNAVRQSAVPASRR